MSKSTEADRVFESIVSDILAGIIRPRDRISERDLVARYGVSRTPIREATKRLLERGLVEPGPKGVAVVVDVSPEDLRKLYELRLQLEEIAGKQIVANITEDEINRLRKINKQFKQALTQRDLVKMLEVRADFHAVLVGAARNPWLEMVLVMLRERAYMVRHYHWQDFDRASQTVDIHNGLIDALERGDRASFSELIRQQIGAAIATYENRLQARVWTVGPTELDMKRSVPSRSANDGAGQSKGRGAASEKKPNVPARRRVVAV